MRGAGRSSSVFTVRDKTLPPWLAKLDREVEELDRAIGLLRAQGFSEEAIDTLRHERERVLDDLQERQASHESR